MANKIKKEKRGEGFEKLMTVIASAFNPNDKVAHNIKIRENSGNNRQIDVIIEGRNNIIIECKDKSNPTTVSEMGSFVDLCKSTNSEGIFVSKKGFQKGAITKANFEGIKIYTLDKVDSGEFKENFIKPICQTFIFNLQYKSHTFHIPEELSHLLPFKRDDEFIYEAVSKEKSTEEDVVKEIFKKVIGKNQLDFFMPLTQKFLFKTDENIIDRIHEESVPVSIDGQLHFLSNEQFVPIAAVTFNIEYSLGIKDAESDLFQQKDMNGEVLSETISASIKFEDKPYKLNFVSNLIDNNVYGALVPDFRSSEILPLENYGEINNPFKKFHNG